MKISNNSLAVLLVAALIISLFGTLASVYYINPNLLTGYATSDYGNVTLTVSSTLSCSTSTDRVSALGSVARNNDKSSENASQDFVNLTNDGNQNLNATENATIQLWSTGTYATPTTYWKIHCNSSTGGTCNTTYANVQNASSGAGSHTIVYSLPPASGTNTAMIGFWISVPNDEPQGAKAGQVTFWCTGA